MKRSEINTLEELLKDVGDDIYFFDDADKIMLMIRTIDKLVKPYR